MAGREPRFSSALRGIVPYEPGKPVEEVQRELGIERVVKLASNEGPYGPFPAALEALQRATPTSTATRTAAPTGSAGPWPSGTASASRRS